MDHRTFSAVRAVLTCILVVIAGCATTGLSGEQSDGTPTLTEADVHPGSTPNLDVYLYAMQPVHITITELGPQGRGVVVNETYDNRSKVEFGDHGTAFRENGHYRVVILVDGTERWNVTVSHTESYELRVESNGSVTVKSHSTA